MLHSRCAGRRDDCCTSHGEADTHLLSVLRKLFFWNYARNTWQWDALCVVILVFIFLTPKSWFENSERRGYLGHQSPVASTVLIGPEGIENVEDKGHVQEQVQRITGRTDVQVVGVRKISDREGKARGYEVDIR
jgi:hypothetical protein